MVSVLIRSFAPVVDRNSRILVLGTMPGPMALAKREYYGYTHNHFWRIIGDLFAPGRTLTYAQKIRLLKKHRIALWDVLASCERKGAADASMRCLEANPVADLIALHPHIEAVYFNGKTAEKLFHKFFGDKRLAVRAACLPSTSPANAQIPYARKKKAWSVLRARSKPKST